MSAIFFSIFPALLLIFAALTVILIFKSEIDNMSITCSDLVGRPRNLFNFLINPGIFLPWTLIEEKNPTETVTLGSAIKNLGLFSKKEILFKGGDHLREDIIYGNTVVYF